MKIQITPRHFELTQPIEEAAIAKVGALEEIAPHIESAHVILSHDQTAHPDSRFTASVRLAVAGPDLHAEETSENLYSAIDSAASKLARQLRKRKTRLTDKRRSDMQRSVEKEKKGIA